MFLRKRMRKAFTNGVLHAHRYGNAINRYSSNEEQWAYEAGYREGEKVVKRNAVLRLTRLDDHYPHHDGPLPPKTPRPYMPMTPPPAPRRPDPFLHGERRLP